MLDYIIQPWGTSENDTEAVPAEIEKLAYQVMTHYDMKVQSMQPIATKPKKGGVIWKIETNKGPRSLKLLHRSPERSLFSIGAQEYLVNQGARVPKLIPSKSGTNYVEKTEKLWIVAEWIDTLTPVNKDLEGVKSLCYGLGEFHRHSQGYVPPFGAKHASRLYHYPKKYRKIIAKLGWFRVLANTYSEQPASQTLLSMIDRYEPQAHSALERLENSPYSQLVAKGEPYWGIVHQDYGWGNGQQGPGGIWVIDLDGVAYDLPIRDLRKLITSTMDNIGTWDMKWIKEMIQAYHQANPIDPDLYQILLIDLSMPNEFYEHVKEIVYSPTTLLNEELEISLHRLVSLETTKWSALQKLSKSLKIEQPRQLPIQEIIPIKDSVLDSYTDRINRKKDKEEQKIEQPRQLPIQEIIPIKDSVLDSYTDRINRKKDKEEQKKIRIRNREERRKIRHMRKEERQRIRQMRHTNRQMQRMNRKEVIA